MRWRERRWVAFPSSLFLAIFLLRALVGHRSAAGSELPLPAPVPVRVGVIHNQASPTGKRLQTSIRMAVEDYYSVHPKSATRVELQALARRCRCGYLCR